MNFNHRTFLSLFFAPLFAMACDLDPEPIGNDDETGSEDTGSGSGDSGSASGSSSSGESGSSSSGDSGGEECEDGDTQMVDCNDCFCEDGVWACTEKACEYDPCGDQLCGVACTQCAPDDDDCVETTELKICDGEGACVSAADTTCSTSTPTPLCSGDEPQTSFLMRNPRIESEGGQDTLFVDVEVGGGCAEHRWEYCFTGEFRESIPVQSDVRIVYYAPAEPDPCDAIVMETVEVDLNSLRDTYRDLYQTQSDTLDLFILVGSELDSEFLPYSF